jgi:hypothetical protein
VRSTRSPIRGALGVAALLGLVGVLSTVIADVYGESRTVSAEEYTAEGNEDRLVVIEMALDRVADQPFEGWGSGLLGMPVGHSAWSYSHVMVLDPLLETGLIGATPFFLLHVLALVRFARLWRSSPETDPALTWVGVAYLYTMLQSQVSGHVSSAKHAWLCTGLLWAITEWMSSRSRARPGLLAATTAQPSIRDRRRSGSAPSEQVHGSPAVSISRSRGVRDLHAEDVAAKRSSRGWRRR